MRKFNDITAKEALKTAGLISVAPFVFQAVKSMKDLGIMATLADLSGGASLAKNELVQLTKADDYTVSVLLDLAEAAEIVLKNENNTYNLSKIGMYLADDPMTTVNFDFTADVCYRGLEDLTKSLKNHKPEGLKVFTAKEQTIYPILSQLPEPARTSWFAFDHFYSDRVFEQALAYLFAPERDFKIEHICDIGGNTGRFALTACKAIPNLKVTIADLPEQCALALEAVMQAGLVERISTWPLDILAPGTKLPTTPDLFWMSQFLDCFSRDQVVFILRRVQEAMRPGAMLVINEIFGDRQRNDTAKLIVEANSLYFTALANGVSRFYHADEFLELAALAGLKPCGELNGLGMGHSLLLFKKV